MRPLLQRNAGGEGRQRCAQNGQIIAETVDGLGVPEALRVRDLKEGGVCFASALLVLFGLIFMFNSSVFVGVIVVALLSIAIVWCNSLQMYTIYTKSNLMKSLSKTTRRKNVMYCNKTLVF
jgi:hypothetical protein